MLRLAADENFNNKILRALLLRRPELDFVRVQDAGLAGADDPNVLAWAAQESRVLLTHDVTTITKYAYQRVRAGQRMPGVFEMAQDAPIVAVVEDLVLLAEASLPGEWEGQVRYLPLV